MVALVGAPIVLTVVLQDAAGVALTGKSFLTPYASIQGGGALVPIYAEVGGGVYTITLPAPADTNDRHLWARANVTPFQDFAGTIPVVSSGDPWPSLVGSEVEDLLILLDASQVGIAGADIDVEFARKPDGTSFAADVDVIDEGDGAYLIRFTPTTVGPWYLRLRSDTTPEQVFESTYDAVGPNVDIPLDGDFQQGTEGPAFMRVRVLSLSPVEFVRVRGGA
jgi:hypothetical protein